MLETKQARHKAALPEQATSLGKSMDKEAVCPVESRPGEEYTDASCHLPLWGETAVVKAQLEMQAARSKKRGGTIKRVFLKHVDGKQRCRKTITPLQDVDGHLTNRDRDMVRVFHKFFAFASCLLCLRLQHSSMPPFDAFSFSFHIFQVLYCLCV